MNEDLRKNRADSSDGLQIIDSRRSKQLSKLKKLGVNMAQVSKISKDERKNRQSHSLLESPDAYQAQSIFKEVENEWANISTQNNLLHQSMASSYYSRQDIFKLYSRFKALCQLSALSNPRQPLVGVSFATFVHGVQEGNQLHRELLASLFTESDSRKQGILDWASFLQVMIVLRPKSLESRIESCLNLIKKKQKVYGEDQNGNIQSK